MELASFVACQRTREGHEAHERLAQASAVQDRLPLAVELLVETFGVSRVVLFGSLLQNELFADSDVDLAVAGLAAADYFTAVAAVSDVLGRQVDLIRFEEAAPSLLVRIQREGRVLHG